MYIYIYACVLLADKQFLVILDLEATPIVTFRTPPPKRTFTDSTPPAASVGSRMSTEFHRSLTRNSPEYIKLEHLNQGHKYVCIHMYIYIDNVYV